MDNEGGRRRGRTSRLDLSDSAGAGFLRGSEQRIWAAPGRVCVAMCVAMCVGLALCSGVWGTGCGGLEESGGSGKKDGSVLADTSFMADIVQNVAGSRLTVSALMPVGTDPHTFEPTPQDAKLVADSRAVIIDIAGFEPMVDDLIAGAGGPDLPVIEAAAGIAGATRDPHVWLDPVLMITCVTNIAEGLARVDPEGADTYRSNADVYAAELRELDAWIAEQVAGIPAERRLLVTNHESLAYFAARYGFRIVGTVFPTTAGEGAPSAQQLAALVEGIRAAGAPAIFLETGSNADLARRVADETGVELATDLYIHSLGENGPTYLEMMRWNVSRIVEVLR